MFKLKNDAFLTIDSGGSKTNLSLYSSEGTLIKKSTCQGFGKTFDTNEIIPELLSVIQRHCDGYTVDTIVCNLGGRNKGEILKTLKTFSPSSEVLVLRESEGDIGRMLCKMYNAQVALLAGTGSIAIADVEDNTVICGGWGANIGDMGSGYQLGLEAIQQVLKEIDCSEHFSLLSKTILKEECPPRLISASEYCKYRDSIREKLSPFDRYHIAEYAKVVYKCAEEGDDTSLSLYKKVGEDLADIVLSAIAKIGENSVGVVVSGGMVNAKQFWKNHFENRLSTHTDLKNISYIANGIDQALSEIAKRVIERKFMFPKGLIVSSQALEGNPLRNSEYLAVMAEAAVVGGAKAIRANGVEDIKEMRKRISVPIIGIDKRKDSSGRTVITPDFEGAKRIAEAGATIIALDVTDYPSDITEDRKTLIDRIHNELGLLVMADISTAAEAQKAAKMGVDAVSTTLAGYVPGALHTEDELYTPNLELVKEIAAMHLPCSLVVEGRIWDKEDLAKAFELGADAVVIGKAVTNPMAITKYFLSKVPENLR